jgi:phage terminase large subunit-like protein
MNTCGCCKFWQRPDAGRVTGECRRHAPVAVAPSQQKYALRTVPWQKFCDGSIVGWVHVDTGLRRFRNSLEEVPRKNGKTLRAGVRLDYLTFFDGEPGAEGYSIATKRDQAKLAFTDAKKLVQASGLKGGSRCSSPTCTARRARRSSSRSAPIMTPRTV